MKPAHPVAADVLADLLLAAVEADRLEETAELLADLVGERPVREAVGIVFDRLSIAVEAAATPPRAPDGAPVGGPDDDTLELLKAIRATTPAGRGAA